MKLNKASLNLEIGDKDVNSLPILFQDLILSGKNYASKKKNDNEIHEKPLLDGHKVISLMGGGDNIF